MTAIVQSPEVCEMTDKLSSVTLDRQQAIRAAVEMISASRLLQPQVAIILGSGLGGLAEDVQHVTKLPYSTIPHFQSTHAVGHAGQLLLGFLSACLSWSCRVDIIAMKGIAPPAFRFQLK